MKFKNLIVAALILSFIINYTRPVFAQNYADDIAQIIFDNCTSCHHNGGIEPFSLMPYADVSTQLG